MVLTLAILSILAVTFLTICVVLSHGEHSTDLLMMSALLAVCVNVAVTQSFVVRMSATPPTATPPTEVSSEEYTVDVPVDAAVEMEVDIVE